MSVFNAIASVATTVVTTSLAGPIGPMATELFSGAAGQFLQQAGSLANVPLPQVQQITANFAARAGTPQGVPDMHQVVERAGQMFNASPAEVGDAQRSLNSDLTQAVLQTSESKAAKEARAGGGQAAAGWLEALAEVLGEKLDDMAHNMQDLANRVTKDDPSTGTKFTVASQEFNMLMEVTSTAIKTIGEAMGKMAGRQ